MATKGDRNMKEVYNDQNGINPHISIRTCWFYCHSEASVHGHGIFNCIIQYSAYRYPFPVLVQRAGKTRCI